MTRLDIDAPLASLHALHPEVSHRALGDRCTPPVADTTVLGSERVGDRIQVSTLRRYAEALGHRLVLGVEPIDSVIVGRMGARCAAENQK
jgi:hypothetical protein